MKTLSFSRIVVFLLSLLIYCAASAAAAAYPNKPIRLIVPFSAGGNTDIFARTIAPIISEQWGQQIVVDNRGGAGGVIGTAIAARATPDGYTLLFVSGSHVVNPTVRKNLPYDTIKDFTPISLVIVVPNLLVAHPSVPVRSIPELIKLAKARPGKLNYASSGTGTFAHLSFATFNSMAGVQIQHIPYKGNGPATVAIFAGLRLGETDGNYLSATSMVLGVFLGSATWWLTLSTGVSLLRERFTPALLIWVNRLAGGIIFMFGLLALFLKGK